MRFFIIHFIALNISKKLLVPVYISFTYNNEWTVSYTGSVVLPLLLAGDSQNKNLFTDPFTFHFCRHSVEHRYLF